MHFKKNHQVVKLISVFGIETASLDTIESVRKGQVKLTRDEHLRYDAETGHEIDPVISGCNSRIVLMDGQ